MDPGVFGEIVTLGSMESKTNRTVGTPIFFRRGQKRIKEGAARAVGGKQKERSCGNSVLVRLCYVML